MQHQAAGSVISAAHAQGAGCMIRGWRGASDIHPNPLLRKRGHYAAWTTTPSSPAARRISSSTMRAVSPPPHSKNSNPSNTA